MPNLSNTHLQAAKKILGRSDVVKVKQTDDENVGLALFDGGIGAFVNFKTGKRCGAVKIGGVRAQVKSLPNPGRAG